MWSRREGRHRGEREQDWELDPHRAVALVSARGAVPLCCALSDPSPQADSAGVWGSVWCVTLASARLASVSLPIHGAYAIAESVWCSCSALCASAGCRWLGTTRVGLCTIGGVLSRATTGMRPTPGTRLRGISPDSTPIPRSNTPRTAIQSSSPNSDPRPQRGHTRARAPICAPHPAHCLTTWIISPPHERGLAPRDHHTRWHCQITRVACRAPRLSLPSPRCMEDKGQAAPKRPANGGGLGSRSQPPLLTELGPPRA